MNKKNKKTRGPMFGKHHSLESRKKMSISKTGVPSPFKGIKYSKKLKQKISIATRKAMTPEICKKISINTKKAMKSIHIRKKISDANKGRILSEETKEKIRIGNLGVKRSEYTKEKHRFNRKFRILPTKDTSIEIKIQNFLKTNNIKFFTHKFINIQHSYQCDIFIPIQLGIKNPIIIECFGNYWHAPFPIGREIDIKRSIELREQGYILLVFWESEIKLMEEQDFKNILNKFYYVDNGI